MISHRAYKHRKQFCRMQDPVFRNTYIDPIPDEATLPYHIEKLTGVQCCREKVAAAGSMTER